MLFSTRISNVKPHCWAPRIFSLGVFQHRAGTAAGNSGTPAIPPVNLPRDGEATSFNFPKSPDLDTIGLRHSYEGPGQKS
jgi:hypothetical protein